ncbi:MAG: AMP-binding protein [Victivallaceae bacterium]|nr:AMP-binding protein [Victivallaceae bacterium]
MARVTGVSEAEYLEHEEGRVDNPFAFLYLCAERFGVDVNDLVSGVAPKLSFYNVTRAGQGLPIKRREEMEYFHLAPFLKNRRVDPLFVTVQVQDEKLPIHLTTHSGHEFDYVIRGRLRIQLGDKIEVLEPGDSVLHDSSHPHGMVAAGNEPCDFLAIVMKGDGEGALEEVEVTPRKVDSRNDYDFIYRKFMSETLDGNGHLQSVKYHYPENFNFAYDVVDALAAKCPNKVALHWMSREHEEKIFTFKQISELSSQAANYLVSLGIKKGDRVMMVLRRHWQFWVLQIALHKIGATAILAVNQLLKHDFTYRFDRAGVKAIICTGYGDVMKEADAAAAESPTVKIKIGVNGTLPGWLDFDAQLELFSDKFKRPADLKATDPMLMFFSSGTTGYPKIVAHSFSYPLGHIITARWWQNVNPDGLHLTISDSGWAKAMWGKLYGQWLCETGVFVYDFDRFDAADIMPLFKKCHITTFCAPPTMYRFFIREDLSKYDFSSLENACIAGEALNPEVFNQFQKIVGLKMMEGFGQTESTVILGNFVGMEPKPGSMGKPSPLYQVALLGHDGKQVPPGETGEICVRTEPHQTPGLFFQYYNDPEATASAWHDGYYHTGDTAWMDEDGYYWYVGRIDDLIKSSGYRIGPFEIENVLMELPYVLECAVVGVPDETRGQLVKAFIVLTKDKAPSEELKKEIQDYVKHNTAPYKYPRKIDFIETMPKTPSGKIRRSELRKIY